MSDTIPFYRSMRWNWQQPDWPKFTWQQPRLARAEQQFLLGAGTLVGAVK